MDMMSTLFLGHLLGDFPLQSNAIAAAKAKSTYGVLAHSAVHFVVLWVLFGMNQGALPLVLVVVILHFAIDWFKSRNKWMTGVSGFIIDQCAHYLSLLGICWIAPFWHLIDVQSVLPSLLLHFVTVAGFCLPVMVLCWIWLNGLGETNPQMPHWFRWNRNWLLVLEQRIGFGLICILGIGTILHR